MCWRQAVQTKASVHFVYGLDVLRQVMVCRYVIILLP